LTNGTGASSIPKKMCWMRPPPTGPIPSPSGRGHSSSKAATAVVVRISRSAAERPGWSTQARNDGSVDVLHNQIRAAGPRHKRRRGTLGTLGARPAWDQALVLKDVRLNSGFAGEVRVSPLDEYRRTGAGEGKTTYKGPGPLGQLMTMCRWPSVSCATSVSALRRGQTSILTVSMMVGTGIP
jgi:hypothetical protein